ncbi:MAG: Na+/proline symporter [Rhodospirillaceae bacterium]|jgi:solute:Na+ symporter, SSS family|nr:Na+/proline symporter [Rhodospirillaceae bacterium]MBT4940222.1 Na+/proline symporter [Rhodospirillaceae bacterium]
MLDVNFSIVAPWLVMLAYGLIVWQFAPKRVTVKGFFTGSDDGDVTSASAPGLWLLVASAAISWIFAKSIANATSLAQAFGISGSVGYAFYYLSFLVAGVVIYIIRTKGGDKSLPAFLIRKYGGFCAKLFVAAIAIRLFNEVWSNTKVVGLYFGDEGSGGYWLAVAAVTGFTVFYSWRAGLRGSLLTDGGQMILASVLLVGILLFIMPDIAARGLPQMPEAASMAGWTFAGLALVQAFSYPFHDPVLTDRGFITSPKIMLKGFILAGLIGGGFIFLFGFVGIYGRLDGLGGNPSLAVPASFGVTMLLIVNAIMMTSAGSTLDSTFASTAKLTARDWSGKKDEPTEGQLSTGRRAVLIIAVLGNLPLFSLYLGGEVGPAVIAATTISGTMVMGLAPIFMLAFLPGAGRWSFHLAFWPGILLGVIMTLEGAMGLQIVPASVDIGVGKYADDLGVNLWGVGICTLGFLAGCAIELALAGKKKLVATPA